MNETAEMETLSEEQHAEAMLQNKIDQLVQSINEESNIRKEQADVQRLVGQIQVQLRDITAKLESEIANLRSKDQSLGGKLYSIERQRQELLAISPEGKEIKRLEAELKGLKYDRIGDPVLPLLHRKLINAQSDYPDDIAEIQRKIDSHNSQVDKVVRRIDVLYAELGIDPA